MQLAIDLRPHTLIDLHGNTIIKRSIYNRAKVNSWATATLLKGFSGTGKTTVAHILAMMMNCENPKENGDACLECESCMSVLERRFDRDIQVLNGEQSGKSDVIDFTQYISSVPFYDRRRSIFIVEEIDQLHEKAIKALLTSLETVADNVHFILLSMKPSTIELPNSSRCQTYNFAPFMQKDILLGIQADLKRIGKWGSPEIPKTFYTEVLPAIASASSGSYRKALQDVESCLFGEAWVTDDYVELTGSLDAQTIEDTLAELFGKKKAFFMSLERINFQEFFNKAYEMMASAFAYKKTGVIKNNYFEDQIKNLSLVPNLEEILNVFTHIYETNPSYTKKAHLIANLAKLY